MKGGNAHPHGAISSTGYFCSHIFWYIYVLARPQQYNLKDMTIKYKVCLYSQNYRIALYYKNSKTKAVFSSVLMKTECILIMNLGREHL